MMDSRNNFPSFAHLYHEQTKYKPETILKEVNSFDINEKPQAFKLYEDNETSETVDLSPYLPLASNPFSSAPIKQKHEWKTCEEKRLGELSRILYFSYGITGVIPLPDSPVFVRTAPSAGGLYPNEIYVITRNYCESVCDSVFNYQVKKHELKGINPDSNSPIFQSLKKSCLDASLLDSTDLIIAITGVFKRSSWRYKDRAYRRVLLDTGHLLGNIELVAPCFDRKAVLIGSFLDDSINPVLGLYSDETNNNYNCNCDHRTSDEESILCLVALPKLEKAKQLSILPSASSGNKGSCSYLMSEGMPRMSVMHEASKIQKFTFEVSYVRHQEKSTTECTLNRLSLYSEQTEFELMSWKRAELLGTILRRRSSRKYNSEIPLQKKTILQALEFAYNPCSCSEEFIDKDPSFLCCCDYSKSYLLVNNVEGLEQGCYVYIPKNKALKQIRFKSLKDEIYEVALRQSIVRDSGAILVQASSLDEYVKIYGDRAYRYIHMDAGNIGQRFSLACTKLGIGTCGIGAFFDDMACDLLGLGSENIVVYILSIGAQVT